MSASAYEIVTARRASDLIYEMARQVPGRVWIVPDNVCPAVPLALACAGADLRFVDIESDTLCLDIGAVHNLTKTECIAGLVYVRTFGAHASAQNDLSALRTILPNTVIIDDQCIGVPQTNMPEHSSVADAILYSTGYGKVLDLGGGAYGFFKKDMGFKTCGMTLTPQAFADLLTQSSAAVKSGEPVFADYDFMVPELMTHNNPVAQNWSELGQNINTQLPNILTHKAKLNAVYAQDLAEFSPLAEDYQNWRFHIFVQNQAQVLAALFGAGLFASSHYAPVSKLWGVPPGQVTHKLAKNIINLFNDQHFSAKQARQAVRIIKEIGQPL